MPDFSLDSNYFDPEKLADVIDDVFGRPENSNSNKEYSALDRFTDDKEYLEEQPSKETPLISDAEASKTCTEWKDKYNVVVGVSWGDLPYDLQQKWLEYSCDYHLEREDDDKQENGVEEQGEKDGSEEDKVADVAGLPTFDDREELPNVR